MKIIDKYTDTNGNNVTIKADENAPINMTEEEIIQANLVLDVEMLKILNEINGGYWDDLYINKKLNFNREL